MIKKSTSTELIDSCDGIENTHTHVNEKCNLLPNHNLSVKASFALELYGIGFPKEAIGRVLHVTVEEVHVILKNNLAMKKTTKARRR